MITALDTNVLLDVFWDDPQFGEPSSRALERCAAEGGLVACEVIWAELRAAFPTAVELVAAMGTLGVSFSPVEMTATMVTGEVWRDYRSRGGTRTRLLPDFLVAGHAFHHADRLLTRDRGFYRTYFPQLTILDPTAT